MEKEIQVEKAEEWKRTKTLFVVMPIVIYALLCLIAFGSGFGGSAWECGHRWNWENFVPGKSLGCWMQSGERK